VLYFSNQRMFRTEDGGSHWSVISPDLTREDPGAPANLDPISAANRAQPGPRQGVIYAIAPSRTADHEIWAGTDDGYIWRTRDEGAHWQNVTPPGLSAWSKVGVIEASHFDSNTAYAAIDRHRLDDFKPYVYRTHDGGKSWQVLGDGLPSSVNVVREDPVRKGLLYAGTEKGIAVSFDDGDHWQSLQRNLPVTSIRDIEVHGNDLVIATHGRAFWVMDNISPLRTLATDLAAPHLFPPATAIRERQGGFFGSPMPKDEAMAPNPPFGAAIDYIANGTPVTLDILDSNNGVVRHYSSDDKPQPPNLARLTTAPEWAAKPQVLSTTAGMHRFVWSLHYAPPSGVTTRRGGGEGVWAPPGKYTVAMTIGGQKLTQPLTIAPDPRISLPASAYAEQFALAKEIEAKRAALASATEEANALIKSKPDLAEKIRAVTGGAGDVFPAPPPPETSLRFVNEKLSALQSAVDGADAVPTRDARDAWTKLKTMADAALKSWSDLKNSAK